MARRTIKVVCTNVYQDGGQEVCAQRFTTSWLALINHLENSAERMDMDESDSN